MLREMEDPDGQVQFVEPPESVYAGRLIATVRPEMEGWAVVPGESIAWAGLGGHFGSKAQAIEHVRKIAASGDPSDVK